MGPQSEALYAAECGRLGLDACQLLMLGPMFLLVLSPVPMDGDHALAILGKCVFLLSVDFLLHTCEPLVFAS